MQDRPTGSVRLEQGPIPLYYQLELNLRERIERGEFAPGAALPREDQLCDYYGVSRITVRRALDDLTQQGLIVRRRGIGSFVSNPEQGVKSSLSGSLPEFFASAALMTVQRLGMSAQSPPRDVRTTFGLATDENAWLLTAVGSLDDEPVAYLEIWFPSEIGERISQDQWEPHMPVIRHVERAMELRVTRAEQLVEPAAAGKPAAGYLGVDPDTPLLRVRRTYYAGVRPIELALVRYHPERYRYEIEFR